MMLLRSRFVRMGVGAGAGAFLLAGPITLSGHAQVQPTPPKVSSGEVRADVFQGDGSGVFNYPSGLPVFWRSSFTNWTFNPPNSPPNGDSVNTNICSQGGTTTYENTIPFMFVDPEDCDGVRHLISRDGTNAAGVDSSGSGGTNLSSFQIEFTGKIKVSKAGYVQFDLYSDDGSLVGIGPNEDHKQPTNTSGNGPGSAEFTAKKGYPIQFDTNSAQSASDQQFTVWFPAKGTYPMEIDYAENGSGPAVMSLLANGVPMDSSDT
jgi:hypothetical protein